LFGRAMDVRISHGNERTQQFESLMAIDLI
jgi:hypothetical protein